jgi:hypothetical protein
MSSYTEKPLLSIKEVIYIIGIASAVLFYYSRQEANTTRIESKLDKMAYIYDIDKKNNENRFMNIEGQLADLKEANKPLVATKPEEPKLTSLKRN